MSRLEKLMALADEYACAMVACAVSDTPAEHVKSKRAALERALRDALEPQIAEIDEDMVRRAHGFCPLELPHLDRMRWMANYLHNEQHKKAKDAAAPKEPTK